MNNISEVDIAGKGVGQRLHKPVLDEIGIANRFIRIPDLSQGFLFENPSAKLIIIGTPTYKHIQHIKYVIDRYEIVLCEKPVGNSLDEINSFYHSNGAQVNNIYINYQLRFLDIAKQISLHLNTYQPKALSIDYCSGARMSHVLPEWYNDYKCGGGILYSLFSHIIDFILYLGLNIRLVGVSSLEITRDNTIPLNSIDVQLMTITDIPIFIHIDTKAPFDKFTFFVEGNSKNVTFDFISDSEVTTDHVPQYTNGTLSSRNPIPWRIGFYRLISTLIKKDENMNNVAVIKDAIEVHKIINATLSFLVSMKDNNMNIH